MSIGNRIFLKKPEAPEALLKAFSTIPCANISDTMGRLVGADKHFIDSLTELIRLDGRI